MAVRRSDRNLIEQLSQEWEPRVRAAFLESIDQVRENIDLQGLVRALERGDVEAAVRLVDLDPADFWPLTRALESTFEAGGLAVAADLKRMAKPVAPWLTFRFDIRNPPAERWLAQQSLRLLGQDVIPDQRIVMRNTLSAGLQAGKSPLNTALDLVGRVDRATGKRVGGTLGLNEHLEGYSRTYIADLQSGDPARMRHALKMGLRDKRFDPSIRAAIKEGRPVAPDIVGRAGVQYQNRALRYRGRNVARTETLEALHQSKRQSYQQAVDAGTIAEQDIKRFARTAGDEKVRDDHRKIPELNKKGVGLNEPFQTPSGPQKDPPFGPNCRCDTYETVDFTGAVLRRRRERELEGA